MKIYTKTGDKGTSSLYSGERRPKDDATFAALGDVDELNSAIGVAYEHVKALDADLSQQLTTIQSRLLDLGSAVATPLPTATAKKLERAAFDPAHAATLETWIDAATAELPPLANFILPSGGAGGAALHLARSVCRRAERAVVPLVRDGAVDVGVGVYLNRLSDYLFTAARLAAKRAGCTETVYKKQQ